MNASRPPSSGDTEEQRQLKEAARRYKDFTDFSRDWYLERRSEQPGPL